MAANSHDASVIHFAAVSSALKECELPGGRVDDLGILDLPADPQGLLEMGDSLGLIPDRCQGDTDVGKGAAFASPIPDLASDHQRLLGNPDRLLHLS